jgi:ECF transporter S component (folate family)
LDVAFTAILRNGGDFFMNSNARKEAFAGMFIALNIILTRYFSYMVYIGGIQAIRLSFGEIPLILSGMILGPVYGGFTGALADLVGYPLNPQGAYFPGFTITAAVAGFLPGLMGKFIKKPWSWKSISLVVVITTIITSLILNTIWLEILMGKAFAVLLPPRVLAALILIPIYVLVIKLLLKAFSKLNINS